MLVDQLLHWLKVCVCTFLFINLFDNSFIYHKVKETTIPNLQTLRPSLFPTSPPFGCWPGLWLIHLPGWPPDSGRPVGLSVSYNDVRVSSETCPDVQSVMMDTCPSLFLSLSNFLWSCPPSPSSCWPALTATC